MNFARMGYKQCERKGDPCQVFIFLRHLKIIIISMIAILVYDSEFQKPKKLILNSVLIYFFKYLTESAQAISYLLFCWITGRLLQTLI